MLRKTLTTLFFILVVATTANLFAQDFEYPKGVYMSLHDLALQKPSKKYDLKITERTLSDIKMHGGNDYKVESEGDALKKSFIKKEIWAISDGTNLYLNGSKFDCQAWFTKVEHIGKVLVYRGGIRDKDVNNTTMITLGVAGGAIGAGIGKAISGGKEAQIRFVYKLNVNSGKSQKVQKEASLAHLEKTPDLLEKYKLELEPENPDTILKYVILTNHR